MRPGRLGLPALPAVGGLDWAWRRRRSIVRAAIVLAALAYLASGITVIGPDQVGVLRGSAGIEPPLLRPGLHVRWPAPIET